MAILTLDSDLLDTGIDQGPLVALLTNLVTVINELVDDHATTKATVDANRTAVLELIDDHATFITEVTAIGTTLANVKSIYDAHTHECPGSSYAQSRCSTPDTGAAENSLAAGAASAITDTSGSSVPATLSAAGPAALTNATDLKLTAG